MSVDEKESPTKEDGVPAAGMLHVVLLTAKALFGIYLACGSTFLCEIACRRCSHWKQNRLQLWKRHGSFQLSILVMYLS